MCPPQLPQINANAPRALHLRETELLGRELAVGKFLSLGVQQGLYEFDPCQGSGSGPRCSELSGRNLRTHFGFGFRRPKTGRRWVRAEYVLGDADQQGRLGLSFAFDVDI